MTDSHVIFTKTLFGIKQALNIQKESYSYHGNGKFYKEGETSLWSWMMYRIRNTERKVEV